LWFVEVTSRWWFVKATSMFVKTTRMLQDDMVDRGGEVVVEPKLKEMKGRNWGEERVAEACQ